MCDRNQALDILNEAYKACNERLNNTVCEAYLYGSYSRGDFSAESDLDILVTLNLSEEQVKQYKRTVSAINSELSLSHDVTVSITVKSAKHFEKYADILPYYKNVRKEGIKYAG